MSLTVFPTVLFDSGLGSDTTASGAGNINKSGAAAAVTSGSTSATITDAGVDLTGLNQDGSAVLWVQTASGRQFSRISSFTGSVGNWTLTLEDSVWTTGTALTWGIGGKRATFDDANSGKLFAADAKAAWTIQTNSAQANTGATIQLAGVGDTTTGPLTIQGNAGAGSQPIMTCTSNAPFFTVGAGYYVFRRLAFQATATPNTATCGISGNANRPCIVQECIFGDPTNQLYIGIGSNGNTAFSIADSEIKNCINAGISAGAAVSFQVKNCKIHDNGNVGMRSSGANGCVVEGNAIYGNASSGLLFVSATNLLLVKNNVLHNNSGSGIDLGSNAHAGVQILNNNITKNGGYGVAGTNAVVDALKDLVDCNCFGSSSDSTNNTSGPYQTLTAGAHDQIGVSPGYTNAAAGNFAPVAGSAILGKGYPLSTRTIGGNTGGTTTFETIGAAQLAQTGGGSGIVPAPIVSIGPQYLDS